MVKSVLSGNGKPLPTICPNVKLHYEKDVRSFIFMLDGKKSSSIVLPPSNEKLMLLQPFLCIQVRIPVQLLHPPVIEITVRDISGIKRRLVFSTAFKCMEINQLHIKLPLQKVPRNTWTNVVIDLRDILASSYDSKVDFHSVEGITVGGVISVRRIFTLNAPPPASICVADSPTYGDDSTTPVYENEELIPPPFNFVSGDYATVVINSLMRLHEVSTITAPIPSLERESVSSVSKVTLAFGKRYDPNADKADSSRKVSPTQGKTAQSIYNTTGNRSVATKGPSTASKSLRDKSRIAGGGTVVVLEEEYASCSKPERRREGGSRPPSSSSSIKSPQHTTTITSKKQPTGKSNLQSEDLSTEPSSKSPSLHHVAAERGEASVSVTVSEPENDVNINKKLSYSSIHLRSSVQDVDDSDAAWIEGMIHDLSQKVDSMMKDGGDNRENPKECIDSDEESALVIAAEMNSVGRDESLLHHSSILQSPRHLLVSSDALQMDMVDDFPHAHHDEGKSPPVYSPKATSDISRSRHSTAAPISRSAVSSRPATASKVSVHSEGLRTISKVHDALTDDGIFLAELHSSLRHSSSSHLYNHASLGNNEDSGLNLNKASTDAFGGSNALLPSKSVENNQAHYLHDGPCASDEGVERNDASLVSSPPAVATSSIDVGADMRSTNARRSNPFRTEISPPRPAVDDLATRSARSASQSQSNIQSRGVVFSNADDFDQGEDGVTLMASVGASPFSESRTSCLHHSGDGDLIHRSRGSHGSAAVLSSSSISINKLAQSPVESKAAKRSPAVFSSFDHDFDIENMSPNSFPKGNHGATKTKGQTNDNHSPAANDKDLVELLYDPILKCYYDPKQNKYYELAS